MTIRDWLVPLILLTTGVAALVLALCLRRRGQPRCSPHRSRFHIQHSLHTTLQAIEAVQQAWDSRPVLRNQLTPREWDIAQLVARGRSNKEIAAALCLSSYTVENHMKRIFRKLGIRSRKDLAGLVREAREQMNGDNF